MSPPSAFSRRSMVIVAVALLVPSISQASEVRVGPGQSPSPRWDPVLAYQGARGAQVLLFGGRDANRYFGDTWTWDGRSWTRRRPRTSPSPRPDAAATFHVASGKVLLFGGSDGSSDLRDTWTWNGTGWHRERPAHSPPAGEDMAMAYHAGTKRAVLFTDYGETWTWDGRDWKKESPVDSPPARIAAGMTSEARDVLLFGGAACVEICFAYGDTWRWDGTNWQELVPPQSPPKRWNPGLASYRVGEQVLLFGGAPPAMGDTWTWDRTTWQELSPSQSPTPREAPAMTYDGRSHTVVLFGGLVCTSCADLFVLGDTWTWDGATWTCRFVCDPAP